MKLREIFKQAIKEGMEVHSKKFKYYAKIGEKMMRWDADHESPDSTPNKNNPYQKELIKIGLLNKDGLFKVSYDDPFLQALCDYLIG